MVVALKAIVASAPCSVQASSIANCTAPVIYGFKMLMKSTKCVKLFCLLLHLLQKS